MCQCHGAITAVGSCCAWVSGAITSIPLRLGLTRRAQACSSLPVNVILKLTLRLSGLRMVPVVPACSLAQFGTLVLSRLSTVTSMRANSNHHWHRQNHHHVQLTATCTGNLNVCHWQCARAVRRHHSPQLRCANQLDGQRGSLQWQAKLLAVTASNQTFRRSSLRL